MCFTSCIRSTWLRLGSAVFLFLALLVPPTEATGVTRSGDVEQAWSRLGQTLEPFEPAQFEERCNELVGVAARLELRRLTPMALALVLKARTMPQDQAEQILQAAGRLDPDCPEVHLELASSRFRRWSLGPALSATVSALGSIVTDRRMAGVVGPSALLSLLVGSLAALVIWELLAVRRVATRLWHDLAELGTVWRLGPNGAVLAVVVILLPLFTGGDVVFLVLWVFALCWAYLPGLGKLVGVIVLALVAAFPTLTELAFRGLTRPPHALLQATTALQDRRYDPNLLDELGVLADIFGEHPEFHKLTGDLYRQFGLLDAAALAYREGLRVSPGNGKLSLALGTVHYLEGDYNSALQAFQTARAGAADPVVSNYNLSLTLAQTYKFRESDDAMELARQADEIRLRELTLGRDQVPVFPSTTVDEVNAVLARMDSVELLNRGVIPPPLLIERTVGHPLTILAFSLLLFSVGHFLVRERLGGFASACLKCGRAFCQRCRLTQESHGYCAQCMTIFLKKDNVAIDTQMAKRRQLERHQLFLRIDRRVSDALIPGFGLAAAGRPFAGTIFALVAIGALTSTLFWLPCFVSPALMGISVLPLQVAGVVIWALTAILAQLVQAERR